jgi:hypothetical protein
VQLSSSLAWKKEKDLAEILLESCLQQRENMPFLSFFLSFFHSIGKVGIIKRAKSGKRDKFSKSVKKYHQFATGASQKINFVHRNVQNSPISRANRSFLLFLTLEFVCCDQNGDWVSPGADAGREKRKESANCTRNLFCTT